MQRNIVRQIGWAIASIATTFAISGCVANGVQPSAERFTQMFAGHSADYDPYESPAQLSDVSSVVVLGRIASITDGRSFGRQESAALPTKHILLEIAVTEVVSGSDRYLLGGRAYVELPSPGSVAGSAYDAVVPKDADVLLYLRAKPDPLPHERQILDVPPDFPAGIEVMSVTNPQGFVMDTGSDEVVQVLEGRWIESTDLRSFLPDEKAFPYNPHAPHDVPPTDD